jgi:hypothetical protein
MRPERDDTARFDSRQAAGALERPKLRVMHGLAAHAGLNFGELVTWMVEDASLDR